MREVNKVKLKKLVYYICYCVSDPSQLGSTKLNKVLYYSDFGFYFKSGKAITWETYIKQQHGPTARDILGIEEEL